MTSVGCLEVRGRQLTSLTCLSPPLSFVEISFSFVDDRRKLGKERPGERFMALRLGILNKAYKFT